MSDPTKPAVALDLAAEATKPKAADVEVSAREKLIRARVAAGLTRRQAEEVQAAQEKHDKALDAAAAASADEAKKAAKK